MKTETNIAVFASGSGSNFQAMLKNNILFDNIKLLICDKSDAKVLERAQRYSVRVAIIQPGDFSDKAAYEQEILDQLQRQEVTWIFLAGYMRLIGSTLLNAYAGKIVNIHPSLLPAFPGLDAIGQALEAGATETGVTIHYVDAGMDTGPVIAQQRVPILPNDSKEALQTRVQKVEHVLYPETIQTLINQ